MVKKKKKWPSAKGKGAKAKKEEGKVGKKDAKMKQAKGNKVEMQKQELDREIAENAGADGAVIVNRVRGLKGKTEGYDADKDDLCDLVQAGVIDPAKVVRTALQNASSVAAGKGFRQY